MTVEHKDEGLWDAQQVAELLKVDTETVYRWSQRGDLPSVKLGRLTRFSPAAIRRIAAEGLPTEGAA